MKAINCYEKRIKTILNEAIAKSNKTKNEVETVNNIDLDQNNNNNKDLAKVKLNKNSIIKLAKLYLSLGHFYLLVYDYAKSLNSYQKFLTFKINKLQVNKNFIC